VLYSVTNDYRVLQGSIEILLRLCEKRYNFVVTTITRDMNTNKYENRSVFDGVI